MIEFEIYFDGGSLGNPGHGYGSFAIVQGGQELLLEKLDYAHLGNQVTNNQAEYMTLIHGLEKLLQLRAGKEAETIAVVRGDSLLVINQIAGKWKVKNEGLRPLHRRAADLVNRFGRHELVWHDRSNSVRVLGH
ncbi:MAG: ribonuclease HI family protein [Thermomicrobiales bacterium]|nr:ribonuclease HI family protein [Thermomicrobiales bacterium]